MQDLEIMQATASDNLRRIAPIVERTDDEALLALTGEWIYRSLVLNFFLIMTRLPVKEFMRMGAGDMKEVIDGDTSLSKSEKAVMRRMADIWSNNGAKRGYRPHSLRTFVHRDREWLARHLDKELPDEDDRGARILH